MNLLSAMKESKKHFAKYKFLQNHIKKHKGGQINNMQRRLETADIPSGDGIRRHKKTVPLKFRM